MIDGFTCCVAAFFLCAFAAQRSLGTGLGMLMAVGYAYGILRANFLDGFSHFIFDCGLIGVYAAQFTQPVADIVLRRTEPVKKWLLFLIGWPVVLFLLPVNHYLVQLVGLRHIIFFLPVMLFGARAKIKDWEQLVAWLAVLNVIAFGFALTEYYLGIEPFFPKNSVTEIMYRSHDMAGGKYYRIPSLFTSAHAYGLTTLLTLPFLLNSMADISKTLILRVILVAVFGLTVLGLFIAGPRVPIVTLAGFLVLLLFLPGLAPSTKTLLTAGMLIIGLVCAYYIASDVRMQRFTTLGDTDMVEKRAQGSLSYSLLDNFWNYPLGVGLGGVFGSSMPYFLKDLAPVQIGAENEYARIAAEQGIIGFGIWMALMWTMATRAPKPLAKTWTIGTHAMRAMVIMVWGGAFIGVGMLQSIPATVLLMLQMGVILRSDAAAPAVVRTETRDSMPRVPNGLEPLTGIGAVAKKPAKPAPEWGRRRDRLN